MSEPRLGDTLLASIDVKYVILAIHCRQCHVRCEVAATSDAEKFLTAHTGHTGIQYEARMTSPTEFAGQLHILELKPS